MMLRTGRRPQRLLLILVVVVILYKAYRWDSGTEARHDRGGKGRMSGNGLLTIDRFHVTPQVSKIQN